jgi:hypothetical protein
MNRPQFGFLVAFLIAAVWAIAGFGFAAAAVVAGLFGWFAVKVLDGEITVAGFTDRAAANSNRRR